MANEQNLRPCEHKLTEDEAKKGGIASGEARRKKKIWREFAKQIGDQTHPSEKVTKQIAEFLDLSEEDVTHIAVILGQQFRKAEQGDTKSAEFIVKLAGEWTEKTEIEMAVPKINLECVGGGDE